ncbi:MAG: transcription elongation factor GreB [Desulfuromonadales bacterium C00003068]|jgi:transcription elongation factor GreB|nr:MAG: transcription elongation factor GreB [Desulfuromonadales bacterium C00003068]
MGVYSLNLPSTDDWSDEDEEEQSGPPAIKGQGNYMTIVCAERIKAEIKDLLYVKRPEMVKTVTWAASNGDRSENADYHYGKKRLRQIDGRIRYLTKRMDSAVIIDPVAQQAVAGDKVLFGCTVTIENEEGEQKVVSIVGVDEIDTNCGRISWVSPVGQALLGAYEGDEIVVRTPGGDEEYEITQVAYLPLD